MTEFVNENERLRELNEDYDITAKLEEEAAKLPGKLGGAAGTLRDVGFGIVNSIFALVTILILTAFMLGGGRSWIDAALRYLPAGTRGAARAGARPLGARGRQLRGRRAGPGRDRRGPRVHRADDPRRAVRGAAGRDRSSSST